MDRILLKPRGEERRSPSDERRLNLWMMQKNVIEKLAMATCPLPPMQAVRDTDVASAMLDVFNASTVRSMTQIDMVNATVHQLRQLWHANSHVPTPALAGTMQLPTSQTTRRNVRPQYMR